MQIEMSSSHDPVSHSKLIKFKKTLTAITMIMKHIMLRPSLKDLAPDSADYIISEKSVSLIHRNNCVCSTKTH